MPEDRYFQTGDAVFDTNWKVVVTVPKSQGNWVYGAFLGYLELLSTTWPWITGGESTPDDAALIFQGIYDGIVPMPIEVGDIKFSCLGGPAAGVWLACNGSLYVATDYPDLFAAIGTTFNQGGDPSDHFRVPDMRGRTLVSPDNGAGRNTQSWNNTLGGAGGEESHTLITAEIPAHTHTDTGHTHTTGNSLLIGTQVPPPLDGLGPNPIPASTGVGNANLSNTGGDGAHNNLQPSFVMFAYILAKI